VNLTEKAIRRQIVAAITLVLQMARFHDGSRRLTHITEITGMEGDVVSMQDVFLFEKKGVSAEGQVLGTFTATGIRPRFEEKLKASGIALAANCFEPSAKSQRGQR
jgi:pilus assembly protein CpaF